MSDQSSCLPSQQHISHSYRFSPLAQAEDLDAYLMFIFYRSPLRGPVHNAKSLKRWQSPREDENQTRSSRELVPLAFNDGEWR